MPFDPVMLERRGVVLALVALSLLVIVPFLASVWWIGDMLAHLRLQTLLLALVLLLFCTIRRHRVAVLLALVLGTVNLAAMLPFYQRRAPLVATENTATFRLLTYNGYYLNKTPDKAMAEVARFQPDIAIINEFANELMRAGRFLRKDYAAFYPDEDKNWSQRGALSRQPWKSLHIERLPGKGRVVITRVRFAADLAGRYPAMTIIGVHTQSPRGSDTVARRNAQLHDLAWYLRQYKTPVIVAGDFNTSPWSPAFQDFVRESGLYNTQPFGSLAPSWPGWMPSFFRTPIDHVFVSKGFAVKRRQAGKPSGSDHAPVAVDLVWRG